MNKRRNVFSVLLAVLLVFGISCVSYSAGIELAIGGWDQSPSGDFSYKSAAATDKLDLETDLGFQDKTEFMGRVKIDMPSIIPNVYIMATPMSFDGTGTKAVNFTFGDRTFDSSSAITSKLDMDQYDIALYYSVPFLETATIDTLNIDLGLNVKVIEFDAQVTGIDNATGLAVTEAKSVTLPVPVIYAGIQVNPTDKFAIEGEARGIAYSGNHYYDFIGRVKYQVFGPLFIAGGYRVQDIKIDEEDIRAEMEFSGPFAEAGLIF
jgi:outer membrane protein